ncbi:hypothetical protein Q9X44_001638 [Campylobacter coli]|nr:hypothetical protein [Campylobacter coli]
MRDEFDDLLASLAIEPVKKPEIEYQEPLVVKPASNIEVNEANKQNTDLNDFSDVLNSIESEVSSTNNNNNNENIVASSDSEAFNEYIDLRNIKNESDIEVPDLVDTMRLEEAPSLVSDTSNIFANQTQESKPRGYEVPDIKGTTKRVPDIDDSENNVYKLETEYIDIILSYEEELKDLKRRFKLNTLEYQAKGVQTRLVIKAVKQAAKDAKKEGYIIKDENRIQERINNDSNLLGRICSVINSSI